MVTPLWLPVGHEWLAPCDCMVCVGLVTGDDAVFVGPWCEYWPYGPDVNEPRGDAALWD